MQVLDSLGQELRSVVRSTRHKPMVNTVILLMIALGIGATTAVFSVVNSVLIKPLPYPDPDALVRIVHSIGGTDQPWFSDAIYTTYADNTRTLQEFGVWTDEPQTATVTGRGDPEGVRTLTASRGVLTTLGVQPEIGRWFSKEDDMPGTPDTVILTNGYWHRKFGGDRSVIDQGLTINSRPYQIIGVMPAGFRFGGEVDIILPLRIDRARLIPGFRLLGVGRLRPGVTLAQANADVARMLQIYVETFRLNPARFRDARWVPSVRPLKQDVVGDVGQTLWVLMGSIGLVLLMACANVANLLLVRADARRQEFAIRAALGEDWTRLARSLLVESLTLALMGGALGLGIAWGGLRLLVAIGPSNLPRLSEISIDPLTLGFALTVSLLSGLLFGLVPVLKYAGARLSGAIAAGGRGAGLTRERQRTQQALVAGQMALALVLLVSSGLMIRSFQALRGVQAGFTRPERVQTFSISIPSTEVAEPQRVTRMQHEILERIAAIPGVASAAFTTRLPTDPEGRHSAAMTAEDRPENRPTPPNRHVRFISPGMFQTLGTPLVAGRDFSWTDLYDRREVAIISENLAREIWGSPAAALGKRVREFYTPGPWREIVGVAGDVYDDGAHRPPPATAYWPAQWTERTFGIPGYQPRRVTVAIRSDRAGTESLVNELGATVRSVHASLPLAQVRTLGDVYDQSMARTSVTLVMLAIGAAMALFLGAFGLYGVISYSVAQRRREIGVRIALGAQEREVRLLFVKRGLAIAGIGLTIGLTAAAGVTWFMQSLLFGTSPLDPITFTAVPIVLTVAATLASYLPARRAAAVSPMESLRAD